MSFPRRATTYQLFNRSFRGTRSVNPESRDSGFDAAHRPGTTIGKSGPGGEEGGEAGLDVVGDLLRGAILGVAVGAGTGKALIRTRHVVGHARECRARHHRSVARDLDQIVLRVNAVVLAGRELGV